MYDDDIRCGIQADATLVAAPRALKPGKVFVALTIPNVTAPEVPGEYIPRMMHEPRELARGRMQAAEVVRLPCLRVPAAGCVPGTELKFRSTAFWGGWLALAAAM